MEYLFKQHPCFQHLISSQYISTTCCHNPLSGISKWVAAECMEMLEWKNYNFVWETSRRAENTFNMKETLLHISRFVKMWFWGVAERMFTDLSNVLWLDPQKSRVALLTPFSRVMALLSETGSNKNQ